MSRSSTPNKKATFLISQQVLEEAKELVNQGTARSLNAFVEQALEEQIRRIKQVQIDRSIREAGQDPLFLADVAETMHAFAHADAEAADHLDAMRPRGS